MEDWFESLRSNLNAKFISSNSVDVRAIEHSENRILRISETKLDWECSSTTFNKRASNKNAKELRQNQNTVSDLGFVTLAFLQN